MRTTITYLDKNNNQVNKDEAWTIVTKVYNDAGNLQRTGYTIGEAQKKAAGGNIEKLTLKDNDTGKDASFTKNIIKAGRETPCELIITIPEKKKIDKVHARFELREHQWYITDLSKGGTFLNDEKLQLNKPHILSSGDVISFAGKKKYTFI